MKIKNMVAGTKKTKKNLKPHHYIECGLDDVILMNGFSFDEDGNLFISDIHNLHKVIAETRVFYPKKLRGKDIRFMRHYLDWSQKCLGENLGVDYQSVLRWEVGKTKITNTAERLLRALVYEYIRGDAKIAEIIHAISDRDNNRYINNLKFSHNESGWGKAA